MLGLFIEHAMNICLKENVSSVKLLPRVSDVLLSMVYQTHDKFSVCYSFREFGGIDWVLGYEICVLNWVLYVE